jgi:hypothetical protein
LFAQVFKEITGDPGDVGSLNELGGADCAGDGADAEKSPGEKPKSDEWVDIPVVRRKARL